MHQLSGSLILGYHGCDESVAERLLKGEPFNPSANEWDWLGKGIYFWESNPRRGLSFAKQLKRANRGDGVKNPAVVGAVINPGLCLDLTTEAGIIQVKSAYAELAAAFEAADRPLPTNSADLLKRNLDCAVINLLHDIRASREYPPIDSVRGVFVEGSQAYPGAGVYDRTHIQLAICNPECIKGVFRVPSHELD